MAKGRLLVREVLPGPEPLRRALSEFARAPGVVTALHEGRLRLLRGLLPADETDADVAPAGDLYGRCLAALGESGWTIATHGQVRAAIGLACREEPEDSAFVASGRFAGLHDRLAQALADLRHWGVRASRLEEWAKGGDARSAKLRALARIERRTTALLEGVGREFATERIERLLEGETPRALPFQRLLMVAGPEAQPVVADWLRWLARNGVMVEVLAEAPPGDPGSFAAATAWRRALDLPEPDGGQTALFQPDGPWFGALFSDRVVEPERRPQVSIERAADPLAECEWALRGCLERINEGTPPFRLAIVVRDTEGYIPLLLSAAKRLGVPLAAPANVALLTNGLAAWVLGLIEALAGKDVRRLGRIARSSYVRLDAASQEALDSMLRDAHRSMDAWGTLSEQAGDAPPWLAEVLAWRAEAVAEPRALMGWHGRIRSLLERRGLHELVLDPQSPTRTRDARAHTALLRPLAEAAPLWALVGERPLDLVEFARVCRQIWEHEETVLPAESPDGVRVTAAPETLEPMEGVWGLGLLEGVMPRRRVEDPVLSDEDRRWISARLPDLPAMPDSHQRARQERDAFVRLCASAPALTLTYPLTGEDRDNVPAFYLFELERAVGGGVRHVDHPRRHLAPGVGDCLSPADLALRLALDAPREDVPRPELTSAEAKSRLRPPLDTGVTPEEIADALRCAFLSAWRHRIAAGPSRERGWGSLARLPVRAGLATQPEPGSARAALEAELRALIDEIAPESTEDELRLLAATGQRLIAGWVRREFTARKIWPRDTLERAKLEDLRSEIRVGGRVVKLSGSASAVSRRGPMRTIHLFRAGFPEVAGPRPDETARFELGLWLLPLYEPGGSQGVEIDLQDGERRLVFATQDDDHGIHQQTGENLTRTRLDEVGQNYLREVKRRLSEAIARMDPPSMRPEPGDACARCDYGEVCRMARDFGEAISPFELEGELE